MPLCQRSLVPDDRPDRRAGARVAVDAGRASRRARSGDESVAAGDRGERRAGGGPSVSNPLGPDRLAGHPRRALARPGRPHRLLSGHQHRYRRPEADRGNPARQRSPLSELFRAAAGRHRPDRPGQALVGSQRPPLRIAGLPALATAAPELGRIDLPRGFGRRPGALRAGDEPAGRWLFAGKTLFAPGRQPALRQRFHPLRAPGERGGGLFRDRGAGHHRAQAGRGTHPASRPLRRADRPSEPGVAGRPLAASGVAGRSRPQPGGRVAGGSRSFQADQRHARPQRRRPTVAGSGAAAARIHPAMRHDIPAGRR